MGQLFLRAQVQGVVKRLRVADALREVFVGNFSYELPFGNSLRDAGAMLLKGWQLNSHHSAVRTSV